ncbi:MAG: glycosyltransferase family 2 protein [Deltaproteobacteria bacterium]|nr:glycosyltransferase family 2 protein [Deltaproteobacteria bacterium]MBW2121914.1 glycosyltransferase family 2 protein [Deltaproteobacteria bacterium]
MGDGESDLLPTAERDGEMVPVSVYVLTHNNRRTIERCLRSLQWADELIVVDSFSNDGSFEVAKKMAGRVIQRSWPGFREQYQYAADLTRNEWIMFVDADEEVEPELVDEIRRELEQNHGEWDGYICHRRTFYLGRWIAHGGWYPDYEIRLYRRHKGRWMGDLHAKVVVEGRVKHLKHHYLHYTYRDISDQIQTIDRYSRTTAQEMAASGKRSSLPRLLFRPPFRFLKEYLLKGGFRDGVPGLVIAVCTTFYVFVKYAKLWELERTSKFGDKEGQGEGWGGVFPGESS